jgi:RimJ/RimL family protein N-acetyltransferase
VIAGRHVQLTALRDGDSDLLYDWINDREQVLMSAPYRPVHWADHNAWFASIRTRDDVEIFAIRLLADDRLIGTCQLHDIDHVHGTAELQIRIGVAEERGHGHGADAVRALLRHAFADLRLRRVGLHVFADNAAALTVYERAGFQREGVLRQAAFIDGSAVDVVVMGLLAEDPRE